MDIFWFSFFALGFRIVLVGSERIFLKYLQDYDSTITSAIFFLGASILLIPMLFFVPFSAFSEGLGDLKLAFVSAILYSIGFYAYVKAISIEDASLIAPLYNSSLLWLLLLGYIFLDENINVFRITGVVIMFIGVFFLYPGRIKYKIDSIRSSQGSILMIIGSLFIALGRTIDAYAINNIDGRLYAWFINFTIGIIMLIISAFRGKLSIGVQMIKEKPKKVFMAAFTNGWGYLMLLFALISIDVTIAVPASLLSIFVTAYIAKTILKENVEERLIGMIMMILGSVLLFF